MELFIAGGTGFIGSYIIRRFREAGYTITALVRSEARAQRLPRGIRVVLGDPTIPGPWQEHAAKCDVGVNLTGANIFSRWTKKYKREILRSRVESTRCLVQALGRGKVLLNASAVGFYGADQGERELDEDSPPGQDFLAEVCQAWEAEALAGEKYGLRVCLMRFGVVLGPDGGALARMLPAFKWGVGGPIGSGKQWFPWIHVRDVAEAAYFLAQNKEAKGPFNFVAPEIVRQKEFAKTLGKVLHRPAFFPIPAFILHIVFGEMACLLTGGLKVRPRRLLAAGYKFLFPNLERALRDILGAERRN